MKKMLKGYVLGLLTATLLAGSVSYASNYVRIILDGEELIAKDANGSRVYPIIVDGTTYLPIRAIANAFGKSVYWDGANYTVYLGDIDNKPDYYVGDVDDELDYSMVELGDLDNIGDALFDVRAKYLTDNYGNTYDYAHYSYTSFVSSSGKKRTIQTLLNRKYSRFKCTLYVPEGCSSNDTAKVLIKADGKTIYSSPAITKTSEPIDISLNIKECNSFQIEITNGANLGYLAEARFYR